MQAQRRELLDNARPRRGVIALVRAVRVIAVRGDRHVVVGTVMVELAQRLVDLGGVRGGHRGDSVERRLGIAVRLEAHRRVQLHTDESVLLDREPH